MKSPTVEGSKNHKIHHHHYQQPQQSGHGSIKPSQSLTSLPPNAGGSNDGIEFLVPKLRIDRPYNSLKVSFFLLYFNNLCVTDFFFHTIFIYIF